MANKEHPPSLFRSLSGQAEMAEPPNNPMNGAGGTRRASAVLTREGSASTPTLPALRKSSSSHLTSTPGSPRTSRNNSPIRPDKPTLPAPHSSHPTAAAIHRALSASNVPQLQHKIFADAPSKLPNRGQKSTTVSGDTTPELPMSPRIKSPPPSGPNSRRGSAIARPRKPDPPAMPSITVLSATPLVHNTATSVRSISTDGPWNEVQLQAPPPPKSARGPNSKSTLETVQENSGDTQDPSPAAMQASADLNPSTKMSDDDDGIQTPKQEITKAEAERIIQVGESGSESAGNRSDTAKRGRRQSASSAQKAPQRQTSAAPPPKPTYTNNVTAKQRQEAGKQNMTVETETVQSIPQSQLAPVADRANLRVENGGSVKLKPSNETIRPKKERKKADRKTRSVNQGTVTSKADLFEARVASAVDQANESDSDETFVYESNPPEQPRRQRHHSRTPSVASSHSVAEQQRGPHRNYGDPFDDRRIGGKRSMKFSTNPYNDVDSAESNNGTVRSHTPRHIGRYGRGGHHSGTHDQDSPFTQASKLRHQQFNHGRSRPNSPNTPNMQFRSSGFFSANRKQEQPYDFDAEQNADDERTPLMGSGTVRTPRGNRYPIGHHRVAVSVSRSMEDYDEQNRWCCGGRLGACFMTTLVVILVVVSAICFVFASNRPLSNVRVHEIQNVLASEQELMFDLLVGAVNPNTLGISVGDLDVNIFAKSKHVGLHNPNVTDEATPRRIRRRIRASDPDDNNPSPIQDPDGHWRNPGDQDSNPDLDKDAQTMLLGRVFHFDQALIFEASPVRGREHVSSGQLRLTKPGNKTESGGSARWEEIIQYPFELIVRGVIKYQLPISSRVQSVAIGAKTMVHPEEGLDHEGNMKTVPVDESERWDWVEWSDVDDDDDEEGSARKRVEEEVVVV